MTVHSEPPAGSTPIESVPQQPLRDEAAGVTPAYSEPNWKARLPGQLAMVCLAAVAGAVGAQLVYYMQGFFPAPALDGEPPYPAEVLAAADLAVLGDMALGFAMAGSLLAAMLGAGLWLLRGSSRAARNGAIIGLLAGALLGAVGGALNTLVYRKVVLGELDEIFQAMMIHAPFWICMSIAVGLTISLPLPEVSTVKVIGATLGAAILASLLFPLAVMLLFPAAHVDRMVPAELETRLVGFILGAALIAGAAVRSVPSRASVARGPAE